MLQINQLSEKYRLRRVSSGSTSRKQSVHSSDGKLSSYMDSSKECIQLLDTSQLGWQVLLSNQNWIQATGGWPCLTIVGRGGGDSGQIE